MKEFSTLLLIQTMRATVRCVEELPAIDPSHPGIRQFESVILKEIGRLEGKGSPECELSALSF
jgi:hypothetical protein